jgi:RNA polymerase sigma factor (sigma-70 family)
MELLRRFVEGDIAAFETIFRDTEHDIYRWLLRMVRDPAIAEDLVVETFWRVYRSRATFDWTQSFQAWARRIATNVARDHLRRRLTEVALPEALAASSQPDPAVSQDIARKVRQAIAALPPKHRIVVLLAVVEELPYREIAEALAVPVGTVKSRVFHAMRLLRRKRPTIKARVGRTTVVRHTNELGMPTVVHLHGGVTPPESDGFPTDHIMPGLSRTYTYPNEGRAATLWYHDHAMDHTGRNIYIGLAGLYVLEDRSESALHLPAGAFDIPLVIQDRLFDADGAFVYDTFHGLAAKGGVMLVNGAPWPRLEVSTRKIPFPHLERLERDASAAATELRSPADTGRDGRRPAPRTNDAA